MDEFAVKAVGGLILATIIGFPFLVGTRNPQRYHKVSEAYLIFNAGLMLATIAYSAGLRAGALSQAGGDIFARIPMDKLELFPHQELTAFAWVSGYAIAIWLFEVNIVNPALAKDRVNERADDK